MHFLKCRNGWKIRWFLIAVLILTAGFLFLELADPQSSKYIYIYQLEWSPFAPDGLPGSIALHPPKNYTGTWLTWYRNGELRSVEQYKNGLRDGTELIYDPTGLLCSYQEFLKGKKEGRFIGLDAISNTTLNGIYKNDKPFEGLLPNPDWRKGKNFIVRYKGGKIVEE